MKRKWKWLVLLCLPVLCFAMWLLAVGGRQIPVDVIGDISQNDVTEIVSFVKREMRREVMRDFSWQSLKAIPGVIKRNSSIKLFTVCQLGPNFVIVFAFMNTNDVPRFTNATNYLYLARNVETDVKLTTLSRTKALRFPVSKGSNGWAVYGGPYSVSFDNL